jgi:hypothetical protein
MYILDPVHYKEKWEEIPHVKKKKSSLVDRIILQKSLETERHEGNTLADKVLTHGLDPVQTEGVQHGTSSLHHTENGNCQYKPKVEADNNHDNSGDGALLLEGTTNGHGPENDRKLLVSE